MGREPQWQRKDPCPSQGPGQFKPSAAVGVPVSCGGSGVARVRRADPFAWAAWVWSAFRRLDPSQVLQLCEPLASCLSFWAIPEWTPVAFQAYWLGTHIGTLSKTVQRLLLSDSSLR